MKFLRILVVLAAFGLVGLTTGCRGCGCGYDDLPDTPTHPVVSPPVTPPAPTPAPDPDGPGGGGDGPGVF